ncbi:MAG: hypothetical protein ACLFMZ_04510 [Spirochaetaceae bacterium]
MEFFIFSAIINRVVCATLLVFGDHMDKMPCLVSTNYLSIYKRRILTCVTVCLFFNAASLTPAAESSTPPTLVVLPFLSIDAAEFAVLVANKVVMRRLEDTGFLIRELSESEEPELGEGMDPKTMGQEEFVELVREKGAAEEAAYAAAGMLEKEGSLYHLSLLVVDVEQSKVVLSERKSAVGMGDLDRIARDYSERLVAAVFGSEKADEMIAERDPEEAAGTDARISAEGEAEESGIDELERLAEEDPEEAISRLPEKIQEEVKRRAKEEAVAEAREEVKKNFWNEEYRHESILSAKLFFDYVGDTGSVVIYPVRELPPEGEISLTEFWDDNVFIDRTVKKVFSQKSTTSVLAEIDVTDVVSRAYYHGTGGIFFWSTSNSTYKIETEPCIEIKVSYERKK